MVKVGFLLLFFVFGERNKISVITDISILGFYEYIINIEKYRWIF